MPRGVYFAAALMPVPLCVPASLLPGLDKFFFAMDLSFA
jgi:hypothetical protein